MDRPPVPPLLPEPSPAVFSRVAVLGFVLATVAAAMFAAILEGLYEFLEFGGSVSSWVTVSFWLGSLLGSISLIVLLSALRSIRHSHGLLRGRALADFGLIEALAPPATIGFLVLMLALSSGM